MRILWFCTEPYQYDSKQRCYRIGGGWTSALLNQLHAIHPDWEFAICSEGRGQWGMKNDLYQSFPIFKPSGIMAALARQINPCADDEHFLNQGLKAITEFHPDVIQVFGSELWYGLIASRTKIPVILHFQGSMIAYLNAKYPPNTKLDDCLSYRGFHLLARFKEWYFARVFAARAEREKQILRQCNYFFGRTTWDKAIIEHYNPKARYFYCSEALKNEFINNAGSWSPHSGGTTKIVSVLSTPIYKGHDLILNTAKLLKERGIEFSWEICGPVNIHFWEKKLGISCSEVNVKCIGGIYDAEKLRNELLSADIYVHPSYIDNSPNSVCEAQILGLPVIACAVGGLPDLIEHGENGILIPANDPWMLAHRICELNSSPELKSKISGNAVATARARHSLSAITSTIEKTYFELINQ